MPQTIDKNKICDQIDNCIIDFFSIRNIDIYNINDIKSIPHNLITLCLRHIYNNLFSSNDPNIKYNQQKNIINYDDIELLYILSNKFIDISLAFNKSLGIYHFAIMLGADYETMNFWISDEGRRLNPARAHIIENVKNNNKTGHINLLNDSTVGLIAVANNDPVTGLEWTKNNAAAVEKSTVYFLPSERLERLKLENHENTTNDG